MKITAPWIHKTFGLGIAMTLRSLMATIDFKAVYYDATVDPVHPDCRDRCIFLGWHEYLLFTSTLRGGCNMVTLASLHRDAAAASHAGNYLGWEIIQGSSTRGGARALLRMIKEANAHLNFLCDGPRGPRRRLAQGSIFLASVARLPLVPCGFAYDRPWRVNSWDRFAIPRPFSRARAVIGPPIWLPRRLGRDGIEHYRGCVDDVMNRLTDEAESWADSGTDRTGQMPLLCRRPAPAMFRDAPALTIDVPTKAA